MRNLSRDMKSFVQVLRQDARASLCIRPPYRPLGPRAPFPVSPWLPCAPKPGGQALAPCLLILTGCDLEQLQTQPWVWPLVLCPGCKVQGEQDLMGNCCLKGP